MKRARHEVFFIEKDRHLQLHVNACCLHNQKEKNSPRYFRMFSLSVIQLNSPFFLLVLLRSVLIAKKKEFNFFFLFFLFLNSWEDIRRNVSFNYLQNSDHKKTSNFTTRSGRDQRQTKEIANSLLIFKLSFIQKYRYLQLGDKTHSLAIENFPSFPQRN